MAKGSDDLHELMRQLAKRFDEMLAAHKETEYHVVRMMERQGDLEHLTKQVVENNMRLSRILEVHDYSIDELDARLRRLEGKRKRNGHN